MIELTQEQSQALRNGEPVRLLLAELGKEVVFVCAKDFARIQILLEDDREKAAWAALGARRLTAGAGESLLITPGWPPIMVTSNGDRTMQHQVVSREE